MWKILRAISLLGVLVYWNTPIAIALPDLNPPVLSREQMRVLPDELLGSDKDLERAELYAEKGWAYYKHRNLTHALKSFENSLILWPDTVWAIIGKSYCLFDLEKKDDAIAFLKERLTNKDWHDLTQWSADDRTLDLAQTLIQLLVEQSRYEEALNVCDQMDDYYNPRGSMAASGHWSPGFRPIIQRCKVFLAMGKRDDAIAEAVKLYKFGYGSDLADAEARSVFKKCEVEPPSKAKLENPEAKSAVYRVLIQLIETPDYDREKLEKIFNQSMHTASFPDKKVDYSYDKNCPITHVVSTRNGGAVGDSKELLAVTLAYPKTLITKSDLRRWFPDLKERPAGGRGCVYYGETNLLQRNRHRVYFMFAGKSDGTQVLTNFDVSPEKETSTSILDQGIDTTADF